jgi:hypothetical protein
MPNKGSERMSEPLDIRPENGPAENYHYDFSRASEILEAMDILRSQAMNTRIPEIVTMVDASFRLLVTTYYCILRHEIATLAGTDMDM